MVHQKSNSDPIGPKRLNPKKHNFKQSFTFTTSCSSDEVVLNHEIYLRAFWDLEKNVLHEIRVSGTIGGPLLTQKSPTT